MKSWLITALLVTQSALAQSYPVAKKINQTEVRFGTVIEDPYKWMENASDPDLWSWIDEQKSYTSSFLDSNLSDELAARVLEIRKMQKEQNVVTGKASPSRSPRLPLPWSDESLRSMGVNENRFIKWDRVLDLSHKSNKVLSSVDENQTINESSDYQLKSQAVHGGDLRRVIVSQKSDNKVVDILLVKFYTFIGWSEDGKSFYYISDLDERIGGGRPALFRHTVGEIQSEDQLLLTGKTPTSDLTIHEVGKRFFAELDGTIGTLQISTGKLTNRLPIQGEIVEMSDTPETHAIIRSFENANYGELHKLRLRDGARSIFLREQEFVVESSRKLGDKGTLIIGLQDASHVAGILTPAGNLEMIKELKDGTISFESVNEGIIKLSFETYSEPKKVYSYNLETKELKLLASQKFPIEVEAEKIFYTASNGQKASIWVLRKKGTTLSSTTPTILYGYGGFKVSITPFFGMYESLSWIEKGGAFAVVTLPGSLDYGQSWYELAQVGGRIHSWDSFALAGKELIKRGQTSKDHLGMMGASNGGTLVAGTLQRHSDTFKAAVPIVGVMDLLNFTLFTAGKYWTDDYGRPFTEDGFRGIFPLSPYHNIDRRDYPATMVMTAEFDDRVVPMHSYKYLARLQEFNTSNAPILLYNKEWGGHARGSGSDRESSRFVAAFYTFFAQQLGL